MIAIDRVHFVALFVGAMAFPHPAESARNCDEALASDLLAAIVSRDEEEIIRLANNEAVFDSQAIGYLAGLDAPFTGRPELKSAYAVLKGKRVLTKVVATERADGYRIVEISYLPTTTAKDFVELADLVNSGRAKIFQDYVICSFEMNAGRTYMPNACFAETDVMD